MFTGGTIWLLTHGLISKNLEIWRYNPVDSLLERGSQGNKDPWPYVITQVHRRRRWLWWAPCKSHSHHVGEAHDVDAAAVVVQQEAHLTGFGFIWEHAP